MRASGPAARATAPGSPASSAWVAAAQLDDARRTWGIDAAAALFCCRGVWFELNCEDTMSRWAIWTVVILAFCAAGIGAASVLLKRAACRAATGNGAVRDFRQFTAEELDRDVRNRVPLGSARVYVEGFLSGEGMKFSYDPSQNAILTTAPCIKGSGIVIKSLGFAFRFDSDSKLESIESKAHLTGP